MRFSSAASPFRSLFIFGLLLLESDLAKGPVGVRLAKIPKPRFKFENDTLHFSNPSRVLRAGFKTPRAQVFIVTSVFGRYFP